VQVAIDNLKQVCGIDLMGCRQVIFNGKPAVLIRWIENEGRVIDSLQILNDDEAMDSLIGILVFDRVLPVSAHESA